MANPKNLRPFQPGKSGNPYGRQTILPPELRSARKHNQAALIKLVAELFTMKKEAVEERLKEASQLEMAIQGMIAEACKGEVSAFKALTELMCGKIPETDYDGFTEEDLTILNRVKEVFAEYERKGSSDSPESSH